MRGRLKKGLSLLLAFTLIIATIVISQIDANAEGFINLGDSQQYEILNDTLVGDNKVDIPNFIGDDKQKVGSEKINSKSNEGEVWTDKVVNKTSTPGQYEIIFYARGFAYREVDKNNNRIEKWLNPLANDSQFIFTEKLGEKFGIVGEPETIKKEGIKNITLTKNENIGFEFDVNSDNLQYINEETHIAFDIQVKFVVRLLASAEPYTNYSTGEGNVSFTPAEENYYYYTWGFNKSVYSISGINWNSNDGRKGIVNPGTWTLPDENGNNFDITINDKAGFWNTEDENGEYTDAYLKSKGIDKLCITVHFTGSGDTRELQLTIVVDYTNADMPNRTFKPYSFLGNQGGNKKGENIILGEVITKEDSQLRNDYKDINNNGVLTYTYNNHAEIEFREIDPNAGLKVNKTAKWDKGSNDYIISLEAYTTGQLKVTTSSKPLDIVLVLDQSTSMGQYKLGDIYRQGAMKDSVNSFIDKIAGKCTNEVRHRISIVSFATNANQISGFVDAQDSKDFLKSQVTSLSARGETNIDLGLAMADTLIDTNDDREKIVVLFSDGFPESSRLVNGYQVTSGWYHFGVADSAVQYAKQIKAKGAKIYCIGIFDNADTKQLYGENGPIGIAGEIGYQWRQNDNDIGEEAATNRLLNYISNNSTSAENDGLIAIDNYPYYFEINQNWDVNPDAGYYLTAKDQTGLNNVFETITTNITTPSVDIGSDAVVTDELSEYFKFTDNVRDTAEVYKVKYDGNGSWGTTESLSKDGLTVNPDTKTISYTGFDFNTNCVTEQPSGYKLVIKFHVKAESWFIGGNRVPTNTTNAGIKYNDEFIENGNFNVPYVDVAINYDISNKDVAIYVGNKHDDILNQLFIDNKNIHEHAADYVDIKYEYTDSDGNPISAVDTSMLDSKTSYGITATVTPKYEAVPDEIDNISINSFNKSVNSSIYVLKPIINTIDQTMYLGETNKDLFDGIERNIVWNCNDEGYSHSITILGQANLSYGYSLDNPFTPKKSGDYEVVVTLTNNGTPITFRSNWIHDNNLSIDQLTEEESCIKNHYYIRVKSGKITINKKMLQNTKVDLSDGDPIFIFKIEKLGDNGQVEKTYYEQIRLTSDFYNDHSVILDNLAIGTYRVTELSSLRYTQDSVEPAGNIVTITKETIDNNTSVNVNFVNKNKSDDYASDNDIIVNRFEVDSDGKLIIKNPDKLDNENN